MTIMICHWVKSLVVRVKREGTENFLICIRVIHHLVGKSLRSCVVKLAATREAKKAHKNCHQKLPKEKSKHLASGSIISETLVPSLAKRVVISDKYSGVFKSIQTARQIKTVLRAIMPHSLAVNRRNILIIRSFFIFS